MTDEAEHEHEREHEEQRPPLLGSWRRLYALLVIELALITALSYALARWAS